MENKIEGQVIVIGDTVQVSEKFSKRLLVVKTPGEFSQSIPLEFKQSRVTLLDAISVGDEVEVSFNPTGNEYQGKYYAGFEGWKIVKK